MKRGLAKICMATKPRQAVLRLQILLYLTLIGFGLSLVANVIMWVSR